MNFEWAERPELARALFAGWFTGALIGLAATAALVIAVARDRSLLTRISTLRVSLPALGILAANGLVFVWTLVGLLAGVLYAAMPGARYSVAVVAIGGFLALAYWIARGRGRGAEAAAVWIQLGMAGALFAGLLPLLADAL